MIKAAIAALVLTASAAAAYEWSYSQLVQDVPMTAFESLSAMQTWAVGYETALKNATWQPSTCNLVNPPSIGLGQTVTLTCSFPSGPSLSVKVRTPTAIDAAKPMVVVLPAWGADEPAAVSFQADGYVTVHIKFQDWHTALTALYAANGYLPIWGVIADRIMDQVEPLLPAHDGEAVVSSATGSLVAPFYAMYRTDVRSVVTNGVLLSLDWLRRNYRYAGLPNIWDHAMAISYTPVYLTMLGTPAQWQMGTADGFYPNPLALPASGGFAGAPRGQTVDEVLGQFLVLEKAWDMAEAPIEMAIGPQGHTAVNYAAALAFVAAH